MAQIKIWVKFNPGATDQERDAFVLLAVGSNWRVGPSGFGRVTAAKRQLLPPDEGILLDLEIASLDIFHWDKDLKGTGVITG